MMTLGVEVMGMERAFLPAFLVVKHLNPSDPEQISLALLGVLGSHSPDHRSVCGHIPNPTHV